MKASSYRKHFPSVFKRVTDIHSEMLQCWKHGNAVRIAQNSWMLKSKPFVWWALWFKGLNINVNKNPTDATVCRYLFTAKLLYMFQVSQHPSSGVLKTVPAASGAGHTICTATPLQCGLIGTGLCDSHKPVPIRPRWRGVAVQVVWPVPEAAGTVFNTPVDGCCDTWNM